MNVEKHQYLDLLEEKGATTKCPYCSSNEWHMLIDDPVDLTNQQLSIFKISKLKNDSAIPVYVMACAGCGNVRVNAAEGFR